MAVLYCHYSNVQPQQTVNDRMLWTYRVRYDITTDSLMNPAMVGLGAQITAGIKVINGVPYYSNPLPRMWTPYTFGGVIDYHARARNYTFQMDPSNNLLWHAEVEFSPLAPGEKPEDAAENPLERPARFSVDREVYSKIVEQDIEGNQIVNTAGFMYDEPLEQESTRGVLIIQKNVGTLNEAMDFISKYSDSVNEKTWNPKMVAPLAAKPRQALCRDVSAGELQTEGDYSFYPVTFRIALKEGDETWDRSILERGYRYHPKDAVEAAQALEDYGELPEEERAELDAKSIKVKGISLDAGNEPVLLDEEGKKLPAGEKGIFTKWKTRRQADFSDIPDE